MYCTVLYCTILCCAALLCVDSVLLQFNVFVELNFNKSYKMEIKIYGDRYIDII